MIKRIADLLKTRDDFIVTTHVSPDGDALGALLAVGRLLDVLGKKSRLVVSELDLPGQYSFLPGFSKVQTPNQESGAVCIAVDVANLPRLGKVRPLFEKTPLSVNIDHHPDNTEFASLNWVEPGRSSASEMIYDLWQESGVELTQDAALCIYVGMLTDTGRWQYSNTKPKALRIGARLVELGVNPAAVFRSVYENNSIAWFKLLAAALRKAVFDEELELAYVFVDQADLKETGADLAETEGLVDWLRSARGIKTAIVFKETTAGETKASLRSQEPIDVGALSRQFGGGGHKNAAGFVSKEKPDALIEKIKEAMSIQKST